MIGLPSSLKHNFPFHGRAFARERSLFPNLFNHRSPFRFGRIPFPLCLHPPHHPNNLGLPDALADARAPFLVQPLAADH